MLILFNHCSDNIDNIYRVLLVKYYTDFLFNLKCKVKNVSKRCLVFLEVKADISVRGSNWLMM